MPKDGDPQDGASIKSMHWPSRQSSPGIAAHRSHGPSQASALEKKSAYAAPPLPLHNLPKSTSFQTLPAANIPQSQTVSASAMSGIPSQSPRQSPRPSPRRVKHVWDAEPSLVSILSQSTPDRPWSVGGYAGRPDLDTAIAKGPMLPGTMSWYSPRNKIGVHPESLLYNRDPEQLAEDVIGLANRNVDLAEQNRLAKVQINKLSTSLNHERVETDQLSEVLGISSPRRPYTPTAGSRPSSPRQRASPRRPSSSCRLSARPVTGPGKAEWMLSDLQQQLDSAQQLLTQQSMLQSQHRMAWPRPASPSRGNRGARPLYSHISLHPDSRLADAFAIYGVPRGITQYMSKKWGQSSPRGTRTGPRVQHPGSSSSGMTAEQLWEKVEAVSKASHVVLLEAMQLRAYFPPMSSPKETAELQPQLDALIQILHTHCIQVQTELGMLPEEALKKLLTPHEPTEEHEEERSPASQAAHALYTTGEQAFPAVPASSSSSQGDTDLVAEQEAEEAAEQEAEAAKEEAEAAEQAAQESAEQEAERVAEDATAKLAEDNTEGLSDSATGDIASSNDNSHAVQADEEELGAAGVGAHHELRTAPGDSLETIYDGKDEQQEEEAQDEEEQGEGVFADQGTKEEEGANQAQAVDESELRAEQTLNPRPGSGMMDEYLKRMHWSRSSPLPTPPSPPEDTPSRAAMPRRWSKTASVHEVLDSRHANQSAAEVPVDIVTYDDSAADHVAPVSAESAQAAFQQAGQNSMERQEDVVHPGMHIAQTGPAEPIEAVSEMLTRPRHTKFEDAAESEQVEVASVAESTQAEGAQAESVEMLIEAGLDVAELSKESQPVNESDNELYEEVFEAASSESDSQAQPDPLAENADQFDSNDSNPLFGDSNDEQQPLPDADAESAGISHGELPSVHVDMPGQGPLQQPFTPTASPSLFSPSADITDDVDAFSKTLNPNHPAKPDQALYTAPGFAGAHHGHGAIIGADVALTPSYRHQVRSMGQATDNEHPFRSTMPWQNGQSGTEHASDGGNELVPAVPVSRQSSVGIRKLSRPSSAAASRQASMTEPASLTASSHQASFGANGGLSSRSRQSSFGGNTAGQSAIISRQSSKAAGLSRQQSNAALAPQSGQTSIAASPIVSRQASNAGLAALSKQPSTAAGLSKQASDMSTANTSQQSSTTGVLSQQANLASVADVPRQSSNVASSELSRQASAAVVSAPARFAPAAALSRETSHAVPAEPALVSRQSSYAPSVAASQDGSYAVADGVSKQPSYALSAGLSREGSYAVAAGLSKPGSGAFSKQPSYVPSAELSRESSYAMTGPLSKQPSYIAVPAATTSSSRRASLGARLLKETSQVLAPEDSEGQLAEADLAGGDSSGEKAWRETSQPEYAEADDDWLPTSGTVSRQQSFPPDHNSAHSAAPQTGTARQASLQASAEKAVSANSASVSRQPSVAAAPSNDNIISHQASLSHADSAVTLPAYKPVSRQQSLTAGATVSSNPGSGRRAVSRQPSMAKPGNSSPAPERRAISRQPSGSGSLPASTTVSRQQSVTQATNESAPSRRMSRQTSMASVPAYSSSQTSIPANSNGLPLPQSVSRQASVTAATSAASAGNIDAPVTSKTPSRQNSGGSGPASSQPVSRQASVTAAVSAKLPSRQTLISRGTANSPSPQPVTRQASVTSTGAERMPSKQTSLTRGTASSPSPQPVSRQASVPSTGAEVVPSRPPSMTTDSANLLISQPVSRQASRQTSMTRGAAISPVSQPVSRQASVTSAAKTPAREPSQQPSVNSTSLPTSKPVSRQPSVTTGASGSGSLAAMHRRLSTSRKAPAVALAPTVIPSTAVAAPSLRSELSMPGSIAGVTRQTSLASSIADDMLKPVLHPQNSATSDASHYETSHAIESATAHEKHAYLHSQHGLDDVF